MVTNPRHGSRVQSCRAQQWPDAKCSVSEKKSSGSFGAPPRPLLSREKEVLVLMQSRLGPRLPQRRSGHHRTGRQPTLPLSQRRGA